MNDWKEIYRDSVQVIEQRQTGEDSENVEQRQTWLVQTTEAKVQALTDAVDTLIIDALGV